VSRASDDSGVAEGVDPETHAVVPTVDDMLRSAKTFDAFKSTPGKVAKISAYVDVKLSYVTPEDLKFGEEQNHHHASRPTGHGQVREVG
jgi:hypothetical protein